MDLEFVPNPGGVTSGGDISISGGLFSQPATWSQPIEKNGEWIADEATGSYLKGHAVGLSPTGLNYITLKGQYGNEIRQSVVFLWSVKVTNSGLPWHFCDKIPSLFHDGITKFHDIHASWVLKSCWLMRFKNLLSNSTTFPWLFAPISKFHDFSMTLPNFCPNSMTFQNFHKILKFQKFHDFSMTVATL